ncbi:hypothetical protein HanPI659440_Chr17g0689661 [Helianthus annuus]|nr:hypothetical protein HanPI659440_Chr17g0689661 [Helianthus annuus]
MDHHVQGLPMEVGLKPKVGLKPEVGLTPEVGLPPEVGLKLEGLNQEGLNGDRMIVHGLLILVIQRELDNHRPYLSIDMCLE